MKCPHCNKDIRKGVNEKRRKLALLLAQEGYSDRAISKLFKGEVSYTTIGRWRKGKE